MGPEVRKALKREIERKSGVPTGQWVQGRSFEGKNAADAGIFQSPIVQFRSGIRTSHAIRRKE
jgi:hypothetical protein